jgi:hydroxymethylpyrimidine/phosphomethylpyrimidine kinase
MLSSKQIIETVARKLGDYPVIVDPVMIAESGGGLIAEDAVSVLKEKLLPKALLVTPNIHEAEALTGIKIKNKEDMEKACKEISKLGCNVIVKGGHLNATDILYYQGNFYEFKAKKFEFATHGSGCTFASAITAELAKGNELTKAVEKAKEFITEAISTAYKPGRGLMVVNQWGDIIKKAEKYVVLSELKEAVARIENLRLSTLIPEVGTNIGYSLPDGKNLDDVAAVEGRIVRLSGGVKAVGGISFGASKHIATIIITAMKYDSSIRSAMNIRYSQKVVEIARELGLNVSSFSREEEPEGKSTMEWGTSKAIKKIGRVPDIIFDLGAVGKEPMVRILGATPNDVIAKLEKILHRMEEKD